MISALHASNMSFQGAARDAYENLIANNRQVQQQEAQKYASSLEHPTPPTGQGQKLDVVA